MWCGKPGRTKKVILHPRLVNAGKCGVDNLVEQKKKFDYVYSGEAVALAEERIGENS